MHSVSIVFRKRGNGFRRRRSPCPVVLAQHLNRLRLPGYPYGTSSIFAHAFHRSCFQALEIKQAAFGMNVRGRSQREKVPGGGASGY